MKNVTRLRAILQKRGFLGGLYVALHLAIHYLWTNLRISFAILLAIVGIVLLLWQRPHSQREFILHSPTPEKPARQAILKQSSSVLHDALWKAVGKDRVLDAAHLLAQGANANDTYEAGVPILCFANSEAMTALLLEHGAEVDSTDGYGRTALMHARTPGQARILLAAGADVNARGIHGDSALFHNNADTARLLLEHGADVSIKDDEGKTALDYARKGHANRNVIRMLKGTAQTKRE